MDRGRAGLRELFSLPDGYEVLLGNGGTEHVLGRGHVRARSSGAASTVRSASSRRSSRGVDHEGTAPRRPRGDRAAPGRAPAPCAPLRRRPYRFPTTRRRRGDAPGPPAPSKNGDDGLVLVDATSGAGGLHVDPARSTSYYFAPQKCFGSEGGLWLALLLSRRRRRAIERIAATDRWRRHRSTSGIALEQSRLDQTYNTPTLATLFLLARHRRVDARRTAASEWGARAATDRPNSCTGGPKRSGAHDAVRHRSRPRSRDRHHRLRRGDRRRSPSSAALRANGILDVEPYRKLGRNQLRVGLFPAIEPDDVARLTRSIDYVIEHRRESGNVRRMPARATPSPTCRTGSSPW